MNKLAAMRNNVKKNLREDIEAANKKGKRKDPNALNYYDLKDGEKMTVLFVASEQTGDIWFRHGLHGKGLRGIDRVRCPRIESGGTDNCPICEYGFALNAEYKEGGSKDPVLRERYRTFLGKDQTAMQCVVMESPMEISQSPDGNQVKMFIAPKGIVDQITNQIVEGQLDEDDIVTTPFTIKKTNNGGGFPKYDDSFFARKPIADADLEAFDDKVIETWDFRAEGTPEIPKQLDEEGLKEWLEKAIRIYDESLAADAQKGGNGGGNGGGQSAPDTNNLKSKVGGGLAARKAAMDNNAKTQVADNQKPDLDHSLDDQVPDFSKEEAKEEPKKEESGSGGIRSRLSSLRR
ncbi:MAG: hypothetical protein CMF22_11730 [Idiomarinaceae bacterium]|nr:hypothetical protein [Idiomarinaceae bacterium]|tara:strand:- start:48965 stop:50008 length:1044 start_codon:yes stop_codon:yes gene_type:complete